MKTHSQLLLLSACLSCVSLYAEAQGQAPASVKPTATSAKSAQEVRVQYTHSVKTRVFTAYYANLSQARLKVAVQNRFDPELAKVREYFICELTGAGITSPVVFDADDAVYRTTLLGILERFKSESLKSGELAKRMSDRKKDLGGELSQAETKLVELTVNPDARAAEVEALQSAIAKLREEISVAEEVAKMKSLSGEMGVAKVHLDHPAYPFVATFEPEKQLYLMRAGYALQISSKDVDYYIDLVKRVPELKQRLLEGEVKDTRLRAEVKKLFESDKK